MLILSRKAGQIIRIGPAPGVDPLLPVGMFFDSGPIEIIVTEIRGYEVKLGIDAHPDLLVLRGELNEML